MPTPVESIEEFKVATSGQTADFNGSSGSQVQMVTKRGTNAIHGSAYEYYYATDVGAANTWDNNHTPSGNLGYTPLPITHSNRFGGALGGPIIPKKLLGGKWYFFVNYEGLRYPQSAIYSRAVPTPTLRAGVVFINEGSAGYVPYNLNQCAGHGEWRHLPARDLSRRFVRSARHRFQLAGQSSFGRSTCRCRIPPPAATTTIR